jgi:hypothetical protein
MKLINHRINSIDEARAVKKNEGAEIDIRTLDGDLILSHDPFLHGNKFSEWLEEFNGNFLILNLKEMGIEDIVIEELQKTRPEIDYFLLDLIMPTLLKSISTGKICASRISEFESAESALKTNADWFWLDSFSGNWDHVIDLREYDQWKDKKFCIVSPELQGRELSTNLEFKELNKIIQNNKIRIEAICTKNIDFWETNL